jgi:hypothetical protein
MSFDDDPSHDVRNVADPTSNSSFMSKNEPGQWICWNFHEMRLRPTHYTIKCYGLKSWVVEGSLDFTNWTEIDRKTNNENFKSLDSHTTFTSDFGEYLWKTASFAVSNWAECRFIRLTQTGKSHFFTTQGFTHYEDDQLAILAFEFFGTLLE